MTDVVDGGSVIACTDRASWLQARRQGIGASDAAAVLGVGLFGRTAHSVFMDKLGFAADADAENEAAELGLELEPVIAARYERKTGRTVVDPGRFTIRRSVAQPFMQASLDREILPPTGEPPAPAAGPGVLEIKTCSAYKAEDWEDEPPLAYQIQVQHQLAVTGYAWGSIAVLIGGQKFRWMDVARNDRFIATLIEQEAAFWQRVLAHEPPDPDASDACRTLLHRLYPRDVGPDPVALPPAADEWDAKRQEAIAHLKEWEAVKTEAENRLKAAIGDAPAGLLGGGCRYSWKASERAGYTVAPTTTRVLRRHTK